MFVSKMSTTADDTYDGLSMKTAGPGCEDSLVDRGLYLFGGHVLISGLGFGDGLV